MSPAARQREQRASSEYSEARPPQGSCGARGGHCATWFADMVEAISQPAGSGGSRHRGWLEKAHRGAHPACQDYDLRLNRNICHQESEDLEPGSETNTFHNHCNKQTLAATTNNSDSTELAETATNILSFVMPRRLVCRHTAQCFSNAGLRRAWPEPPSTVPSDCAAGRQRWRSAFPSACNAAPTGDSSGVSENLPGSKRSETTFWTLGVGVHTGQFDAGGRTKVQHP